MPSFVSHSWGPAEGHSRYSQDDDACRHRLVQNDSFWNPGLVAPTISSRRLAHPFAGCGGSAGRGHYTGLEAAADCIASDIEACASCDESAVFTYDSRGRGPHLQQMAHRSGIGCGGGFDEFVRFPCRDFLFLIVAGLFLLLVPLVLLPCLPSLRPSGIPYNCAAGYATWQATWPRAKQEWCCRLEGRGCTNQMQEVRVAGPSGAVTGRSSAVGSTTPLGASPALLHTRLPTTPPLPTQLPSTPPLALPHPLRSVALAPLPARAAAPPPAPPCAPVDPMSTSPCSQSVSAPWPSSPSTPTQQHRPRPLAPSSTKPLPSLAQGLSHERSPLKVLPPKAPLEGVAERVSEMVEPLSPMPRPTVGDKTESPPQQANNTTRDTSAASAMVNATRIDPVGPFDCSCGSTTWKSGWSIYKKAWCCQRTGTGCPPAPTDEHG